jgi:hypothetical protein
MSFAPEDPPVLTAAITPPIVLGAADLAHFANAGHGYDDMIARIADTAFGDAAPGDAAQFRSAQLHDTALACQYAFRRAEGLGLQDEALQHSQLYRIGRPLSDQPLRLLALMGPGDLMVNTPLDFLTNHLDVRLDLLYVLPDTPLPSVIPDHDVAFFAQGEADPATLARLSSLFARWPRPALNNPACLTVLARDTLSRSLASVPSILSPAAAAVTRDELDTHLRTGRPIAGFDPPRAQYPCLIRPFASHAGQGLSKADTPEQLRDYLRFSFDRRFYLTAFEDYSGSDGLFRKSRIGFIDRQPFLCHMAVSRHWMVHYLNAGMTESAEKRSQEAAAMATFDDGFGRRHAAAFAALHERLGFDFYSIDCAETRDGRLLVFEADSAAIIHLMDPPEMFPYKQPQMRKVFGAFDAMLRRRAGSQFAATNRLVPLLAEAL